MAIFHATLKIFTRAKGQSAPAAAAYRAGISILDERTGLCHDYSHRKGVLGINVIAPSGAPEWVNDLAKLWNAAEAAEVRVKSARTARELLVALPIELPGRQRATLANDIAQMLVDRYRVATMVALHEPDSKGDERNYHAHIMLTTRVMTADGFGPKVRVLDDRKTGPLEVELIRGRVAEIINEHLKLAGRNERVDHRTLKAQARAAERRGDIVSAILLTREPTIREDRVTVEARRRGKHDAGSAWNDDVRASNVQMLADFLAIAQAKGRGIATPPRSGLAQAKIDHARETTNEANETTTAVQALTSTGRIPRVRSSDSRGVRHRLAARSGAATRAEGKDAALLNAAAAQTSEVLHTQGEVSQKYIDMLQQIIAEFGQRASNAVAYACMFHWPFLDVRALAQYAARDLSCGPLLGQAIKAGAVWRRAQTLATRRRERYGNAMVATVWERQAVDALEQSTEPSHWKKRTHREWAEFRRRERAGLERAQRRERRAEKLVSSQALVHYLNKTRSTRDALDQIEAKRRARYSVPGDDVMRVNAATATARIRPVSRPRIEPFAAHLPVSPPHSLPPAANPRLRPRPNV